ncbi:MAG: hypothetical protein RIM84_25400 [Alphaproteobacteria bacterium]
MPTAPADDFADPRKLVRAYLARLERDGFYVTVSSDMNAWVSMMEAAPAIRVVNPTFDPAHSQLDASNSFWVRVTDMADNPVACIANRLFDTDDYLGLIRNWRLWYDRGLKEVRPLNIVLPDTVPFVAGRIGHHGGLWVHPGHRKRGLSFVLPRLTRALSLANFRPDWHCGMVFGDLGDSGLPKWGYGYTNMELCIDGYFPVTGRDERVYMTYISRADMLDQTRGDLDLLELHPDQQLVDVVAVAGQRQDQPRVATG